MYHATEGQQAENEEYATNVTNAWKSMSDSQNNVMSTLKELASDIKSNSSALDEVLSLVRTIESKVKGKTASMIDRTGVVPTSSVGLSGTGREEVSNQDSSRRRPTIVSERVLKRRTTRNITVGNRLSNQWYSGIQLREFYLTLCDEDAMDMEYSVRSQAHEVVQRRSRLEAQQTLGWTVDPSSIYVFLLDTMCALVLVNDLVISPFALAWSVDDHQAFYVASTIGSCYWLVDLFCTFFIGVYINGELQPSFRARAKRYIKKWFLMDFTVLVIDWTFVVTLDIDKSAGKGVGRLPRAFRMIKLLRLLRVLKISKLLRNPAIAMWTLNMNRRVDQVLEVIKVLSIMLFINHVTACMWFVIGVHAPTDTGKSWVQQPGIDLSAFGNFDFSPAAQGNTDATLSYQYVAALHQITAHIFLASCNVYPNSSIEGIVGIIFLIYGLLFSGTLVSYFSTTMTQRALASHERNKQLEALREYIHQWSLRPPLALLVYKAARARLDKSMPLTEDEVPAINLLPYDLYQWIYRETRLRYLLRHPLFLQWVDINGELCQLLCEKASTFIFRSQGDVVFVAKEVATVAYHIVKGKLRYSKREVGYGGDKHFLHNTREVLPGVLVSEAALWTHWSHVGKLVVTADASLLVIDPLELPGILGKDMRIAVMTTRWAKEFHKRLIAAEPPLADWPDDLQVPDTDCSDLMGSEMSLRLLQRKRRKGELPVSDEDFAELEEEVILGKCAIQDDGNGSLERIVAVTAVRLERDDGFIFANIGKWKDGCGTAEKVQLPGTKRSAGELESVSTRRVLESTLQYFEGDMKIDRMERGSFWKESKFGLRTKYSRTVYVAKISGMDHCPDSCKAHDESESNPIAYLLPDPNNEAKLKIFAWLTPQMMTHFNETAEGVEQLNKWVSGLSRSSYRDI